MSYFYAHKPTKRRTLKLPGRKYGGKLKAQGGNGKKTIDNNFRAARKQSSNIVVDLRRIKMHKSKVVARINFFLSTPHRFKKVLTVTKDRKVVEIL